MARKKRECGKCKRVGSDVILYGPWWYAGGNNCSHLEWSKTDRLLPLCGKCCDKLTEDHRICDDCGAMVDADYWGAGYLPQDYDGEPLCPDCGRNKYPE